MNQMRPRRLSIFRHERKDELIEFTEYALHCWQHNCSGPTHDILTAQNDWSVLRPNTFEEQKGVMSRLRWRRRMSRRRKIQVHETGHEEMKQVY